MVSRREPRFRVFGSGLPATASVVLAMLFGAGGCMSYRDVSPNRAALMAEARSQSVKGIAWPARDGEGLQAMLDATPDRTMRVALKDGVALEQAPTVHMAGLTVPDRTLVYKGLHAGGLFRVYEEPWTLEAPDPGDRFVRRQLVGMYRSSFTQTTEEYKQRQAGLERFLRWAARNQKWMEERKMDYGVRAQFTPAEKELSEGVYVTLPPPLPEATRGVLLRMLALGGADYQRELLEPARNQGWRVVNIGTAGALTGLVGRKTVINIRNDEELEKAAMQVAELADQGLAEEAYAVQATMEYIKANRPDLARGPFVIVGFSLGALCTPAVYARLEETMPGTVKAAVLVGGGVNLLDIMMRADIPGLELDLMWGPGRGGADDQAKLVRRYLDHAKLDPYHLAPLLRRIQVLQMHAQLDRIVPADTGEQLYELLGRPARINFFGGHEPMFYFMANQRQRVTEWLASNVPEPWWIDVQEGRLTGPINGGGPDQVLRRSEAVREMRLRQIDDMMQRQSERRPRVINPDEPATSGGTDQSVTAEPAAGSVK